jgi:polyisoprenoid-binding protein YceI
LASVIPALVSRIILQRQVFVGHTGGRGRGISGTIRPAAGSSNHTLAIPHCPFPSPPAARFSAVSRPEGFPSGFPWPRPGRRQENESAPPGDGVTGRRLFNNIMKSLLITTAIAAFAALPALAAPKTFDFKDPKGVNNATFKLDAPLETITGIANGVSGSLVIDADKPEATTGTITIDAKSLSVENPVMKEHMHGKDWMDTATHGEISFKVGALKDVKKEGNVVEATVEGDFTMKGKTQKISVPAKVTLLPGKLADRTNGQMKGDLLVIRSTFTVKRTDFGINPAAPTDKVSDEVEISLAIAGAAPEA